MWDKRLALCAAMFLTACASTQQGGGGQSRSTFPAPYQAASDPAITALEWPSKAKPSLKIAVAPRAGEPGVQRVDILFALNGKALLGCINAPECTIDLIRDFALEGTTERVLKLSMSLRVNGVEKQKFSIDRLDLDAFMYQAYQLERDIPKYREARNAATAGVYKAGEYVWPRELKTGFRQTCGAAGQIAWARQDAFSRSAKNVWVSVDRIRQLGCAG